MSANTPLTPPLPFNRNPVRAIEQAISALREILQRHPEVRRDFDCPAFIAHELEPALEAAAELERARGAVTQEMVDRFLRWPLPASVCSDTCVTTRDYPHQRSGTNLLTHDEARQMLEFVLTASPPGGFSDFIRNASPEEKERVYQGVMERAAERQKAVEAGVEGDTEETIERNPKSWAAWKREAERLTARLREMGERGDYWFDLYQREGADHLNDIQRLEQLERDREALLGFVQGFADEPCVYGDNCPPFVKLNHGQCLNCKARAALSAREGGK
jgi:hypothetical protein